MWFRRAPGFWFCTTALIFSVVVWQLMERDVIYRPKVSIHTDRSRLELVAKVAEDSDLKVYSVTQDGVELPLFGQSLRTETGMIFQASMPLVTSQRYRVTWRGPAGKDRSLNIEPSLSSEATRPPSVSLSPQTRLPANALKLYLHFSQPMEQGVFLEYLHLTDATGSEIHGPFRETELWSPDGKRLTVWFHPGRQKTGVNLNEDEGPVLTEGVHYILQVSACWRSVHGVPLGNDAAFPLTVGPADHACPQPAQWKLDLPPPLSLEPLKITFDEPLDTAMFQSALTVRLIGSNTDSVIRPTVLQTGMQWSAHPEHPWQPGRYELRIDPLLEDLAGNSLLKPFETDVAEASLNQPAPVISRQFNLP
jgi:hypothetical protein